MLLFLTIHKKCTFFSKFKKNPLTIDKGILEISLYDFLNNTQSMRVPILFSIINS